MKKFDIPSFYQSSFIAKIKAARKLKDPRKKDFEPTMLDFGPIRFYIARHFGFCYGVENAVEIAYKALEENPNKRIFLLSEMIHNPTVNQDLQDRGIKYILDNLGNQLIDWAEISNEDIVITPAFGTTIKIENILKAKGIEPKKYNTTCPFVEKVWKTAAKLGNKDFTILIHGKPKHEETRATFSHSKHESPSVVLKNIEEARILGDVILGERKPQDFEKHFGKRCSKNFDLEKDLERVGVVNQTTMLASETHEIAEYFKGIMKEKYGSEALKSHFADTRDTLCYATNDNQSATFALLEKPADLAIVVGGYNSSNTTHLVELCEQKFPTYFISSAKEIFSKTKIQHFDFHEQKIIQSEDFLPSKEKIDVILTSGASCPDTMVDAVLDKLLSFFENTKSKELVFQEN